MALGRVSAAKPKNGRLQRLLPRLFGWIGPKLGLPTNEEIRLENSRWDYARTSDKELWDIDDEPDALRQAMALRQSNPSLAFTSLLDLAAAGSVIAMNEVGECYYWGRLDVPKDERRAERWFRASFKAGSQRALLNCGKALAWRGDYAAAEEVFRKGADEDWAPASYWLAKTRLDQSRTSEAFAEARLLLERAAENGHPAAKWLLGRDMAQGRYGLRHVARGFRMLGEFSKEALAAWERRNVRHQGPPRPAKLCTRYNDRHSGGRLRA